MLQIVTAPNAILSQIAKPVSRVDSSILKLIKEMKEALLSANDPKGVGLAAPQVGASIRIFQIKPQDKSEISTFINPVIEKTFGEKEIPNFKNSKKAQAKKPKASKDKLLEGCLSLPNIWGNVARPKKVMLSWQDEFGAHFEKIFSGFPAIIIQHEIDHLNGVLFPKRVLEQKNKLYKSEKDKKGEDFFEEIEI